MPPSSGALVQRKWLWVLLSSSFALALCSWLYRRTRLAYASPALTTPKQHPFSERAWAWVQWLLASSPSSSNPSSSNSAATLSPDSSSANQLTEGSSLSLSSADNDLELLATARVSGNPRVAVLSTRHTLFSPGEGGQVEFLPNALDSLRSWLQKRRNLDLYLITQCQDDLTEAKITELLQNAQLKGLNMNKVLFCASAAGLQHMTRQIGPELFIDSCVDNLLAAKKWGTKSFILLGSDFPQPYSTLSELVQHLNK